MEYLRETFYFASQFPRTNTAQQLRFSGRRYTIDYLTSLNHNTLWNEQQKLLCRTSTLSTFGNTNIKIFKLIVLARRNPQLITINHLDTPYTHIHTHKTSKCNLYSLSSTLGTRCNICRQNTTLSQWTHAYTDKENKPGSDYANKNINTTASLRNTNYTWWPRTFTTHGKQTPTPIYQSTYRPWSVP